ncbi:MAG TPA: FKBP-type peptidyl-prolyl cis-trans isomerase [Flavisolibacter sp.]|jgi:FKBP-type peptidyl-prolyl cis-trans isomerase FklB
MKKLWIAGLVLFSVSASAQKTTPKKKIGTAVAAKPLKNSTDSLSYALGVSVATFYKQQGVKNLNTTMLSKALSDVLAGKKTVLNENQCNSIIMGYMQKAEEEKSRPNVAEGQRFLEQNRTKPNVKVTATGLQYEVITLGKGARPLATDTVVVNYRGTLINGTEFDNSYQRGEPISFALNRVIPGWTEGLQLMPAGSKYKFYIPHQLGYGLNGAGSIPAGSTLIFEVELLSIKK